jgi:hypothetical protein
LIFAGDTFFFTLLASLSAVQVKIYNKHCGTVEAASKGRKKKGTSLSFFGSEDKNKQLATAAVKTGQLTGWREREGELGRFTIPSPKIGKKNWKKLDGRRQKGRRSHTRKCKLKM